MYGLVILRQITIRDTFLQRRVAPPIPLVHPIENCTEFSQDPHNESSGLQTPAMESGIGKFGHRLQPGPVTGGSACTDCVRWIQYLDSLFDQ